MAARNWIFAVAVAVAVFLSLSTFSSAQDLQIVNAERRVSIFSLKSSFLNTSISTFNGIFKSMNFLLIGHFMYRRTLIDNVIFNFINLKV